MKRVKVFSFIAVMLLVTACGDKKGAGANEPVGDNHVADDLDIDEPNIKNPLDDAVESAAEGSDGGAATPAEKKMGSAVTFRLKNTHDEDLVLALEKGWSATLSGYSGTPPDAKAIIMYQRFCTAACDTDEDTRCPYCPKPKKAHEELEMEQHEPIASKASRDQAWDGEIFVYEDVPGKKKCKCFRKEKVAPGEYTVRACGLRVTKSARTRTKYQCIEKKMTLPAEQPYIIEFEFSKPE